MDLVPARGAPGAPSLQAYDRDHINTLLDQLAGVDAVLEQPAAKKLLGGGAVSITVPPERLLEAARVLRDTLGFEMLTCISGLDMVDHLDSIYHFRSLAHNWLLQVRVQVPTERPEVSSLVSLYASANWLERETYDLYGIIYLGHPDLRRILLDDEYEGYPLRKSFRSTPVTVHDRATTQVDGPRAISGEQTRHQERIVLKRLGQGEQERLHPGMMTFG
ncbi:MAG: NADH-quinone oxidoreductase subunit C, partial [Ktedonobacterales bacterium]|nr:NADH-quinone oxidoreductase subunit C [Ktedonobacterales bacterium]